MNFYSKRFKNNLAITLLLLLFSTQNIMTTKEEGNKNSDFKWIALNWAVGIGSFALGMYVAHKAYEMCDKQDKEKKDQDYQDTSTKKTASDKNALSTLDQ